MGRSDPIHVVRRLCVGVLAVATAGAGVIAAELAASHEQAGQSIAGVMPGTSSSAAPPPTTSTRHSPVGLPTEAQRDTSGVMRTPSIEVTEIAPSAAASPPAAPPTNALPQNQAPASSDVETPVVPDNGGVTPTQAVPDDRGWAATPPMTASSAPPQVHTAAS